MEEGWGRRAAKSFGDELPQRIDKKDVEIHVLSVFFHPPPQRLFHTWDEGSHAHVWRGREGEIPPSPVLPFPGEEEEEVKVPLFSVVRRLMVMAAIPKLLPCFFFYFFLWHQRRGGGGGGGGGGRGGPFH